ncbi:MAG: YraN family protein [Nevskiaceae bacterium]|nr:MAG: YraN family protein [Nevskiaceae bacterium]TBR73747.1 MAG: YraN family protein [Nevskiaceae bacterium]
MNTHFIATSPTQHAGHAAELRAARLLASHGLHHVAANWRCRGGELDLVMLDHGTLVFVEVRARRNPNYGGAAASVDARKQRRLAHAARAFIATHPEHAARVARFDVVAIDGAAEPQWLQSAFDTPG